MQEVGGHFHAKQKKLTQRYNHIYFLSSSVTYFQGFYRETKIPNCISFSGSPGDTSTTALLIQKAKRDNYSNLNHKQVTDNKKFQKTVKSFFTDEGVNNEKITLIENGETLSKNEEIAENLNNYFSDIITNLKLPPYEDPTTNAENITDPVLKAIEKYKNHPSIRIIMINKRLKVYLLLIKFHYKKFRKS